MSRIKFEKAMRLIEGEFINPLSWWPEWFPPVNLAVLQRPLKDSDTTALQAAIESDVKAGELVSTPRPYLLRPPVFDLSKDFAEQGIPCDQPTITALDFAAWLTAQVEKPSELVAAWFAAVGVARAVPAPVITIVASDGVKPAHDGPLPLATGDIAFSFDGLHWTELQWKKPLGDKPKWLKACIAIPGVRGTSETRWNPVLIGAALVQKEHATVRSVRAKFQTVHLLTPWLDAWKTYESDYLGSN